LPEAGAERILGERELVGVRKPRMRCLTVGLSALRQAAA
jgi:hypothetical protein